MLAAEQVHEVAGLGGVDDAEPLGQPESLGIGGDIAVSHGVERAAAGSLVAAQSGQRRGPGQHLVGRPPGEGQKQDAFGCYPPLEQAGDPRGESPGLAGPCSSHHHQG